MAPADRRRRLGIALLAGGLVTIVVAVIVVLEVANGPGAGPRAFAERRSYDQVKVAVHQSYPLAFVAALGGLALAWAGTRMIGASAGPAAERKEP